MPVKTIYSSTYRYRSGMPRTRTVNASPVPDYSARLSTWMRALSPIQIASLADAAETQVDVVPGEVAGEAPSDTKLIATERTAAALKSSEAAVDQAPGPSKTPGGKASKGPIGRGGDFGGGGATGSWGGREGHGGRGSSSDWSGGGGYKGGGSFDKLAPEVMSNLQRDFGLSREEAAAVLGNLGHESGGFKHYQELAPRGGRGGAGWAQWTGPRRREFESWSRSQGLDPRSKEANYGFLKHELSGKYRGAITSLKAARGPQAKLEAFERSFERAGVKAYGSRYSYMKRALELPGGEVAKAATAEKVDNIETARSRQAGIHQQKLSEVASEREKGAVPDRVLQKAQAVALKGGNVLQFMRDQGYPKGGAWCGQFAASVVSAAGLQPPRGQAIASNWRRFGGPVTTPKPGDVAVRHGGATGSTGSHVTIFEKVDPKDPTRFIGIGGNQGSIRSSYPIRGYDFRRPGEAGPASAGSGPSGYGGRGVGERGYGGAGGGAGGGGGIGLPGQDSYEPGETGGVGPGGIGGHYTMAQPIGARGATGIASEGVPDEVDRYIQQLDPKYRDMARRQYERMNTAYVGQLLPFSVSPSGEHRLSVPQRFQGLDDYIRGVAAGTIDPMAKENQGNNMALAALMGGTAFPPYASSSGFVAPDVTAALPVWEAIRKQMGWDKPNQTYGPQLPQAPKPKKGYSQT